MDFQDTELWRRSFEPKKNDSVTDAEARQRLKTVLLSARKTAEVLLGEIPRFLPHFTDHSISHIDMLWHYASFIAGPKYSLNPLEAFVLGTAFLIHDAGMSLPAIGGIDALQSDEFCWKAHLREAFLNYTGREAEETEISTPPEEILSNAICAVLREQHATKCEDLVTRVWHWRGKSYTLIEDAELRDRFGRYIGRVAGFHGDSIEEVDSKFGEVARIGALPSLSSKWECDLLKVALLLRTADAAHLDYSRAPGILAAVRKPTGYASFHWIFQQKLGTPVFIEASNTLFYQSIDTFSAEEDDAWWLAYDALRMLDYELASADALLRVRRSNSDRFQARGVQNVKSPTLFAKCVQVSGWLPVDATVRIEDPTNIIRRLGGEQLYGDDYTVPLRELLQNAVDAVLARRILEDDSTLGEIEVELLPVTDGWQLSVSDDGIGMGEEVLTKFLLSFGKSFWNSTVARQKFPKLIGSGYRSTGRFGIGFFSVFMLGNSVRLITKQIDVGDEYNENYYRTLRFVDGLRSRPVIQKSTAAEKPKAFNTRVTIDLDANTAARILRSGEHYANAYALSKTPFEEGIHVLLSRLAGAFPVNLSLKTSAGKTQVVKADDWIDLDSLVFYKRLGGSLGWSDEQEALEKLQWMLDAMRPIYAANDSDKSKPVGRFGVFPAVNMYAPYIFTSNLFCAVLSGPFPAARITEFAGVIAGEPIRAARDDAIVDTTKLNWAAWIREQCDRMADGLHDASFSHQTSTASLLMELGGTPKRLHLVMSRSGPFSLNTIGSWIDNRTSFTLHLRGKIDMIESDNVLIGEQRAYEQISKTFKGVTPRSLPDLLLEVSQERWGTKRTSRREISSGTWEFERLNG